MALTARPPPPPERRDIMTAAIVRMVGKGMSVRQIVELFPELKPNEIRAAMVRATNLISDENASLRSDDTVGEIIAEAQACAGLTEEDALELAVEETRKARAERAERDK